MLGVGIGIGIEHEVEHDYLVAVGRAEESEPYPLTPLAARFEPWSARWRMLYPGQRGQNSRLRPARPSACGLPN